MNMARLLTPAYIIAVIAIISTTAAASCVEVYNVTLITGDIVRVIDFAGERHYFILNSSKDFQMLKTPEGTYIIPEGVDLAKFDLNLFNIDYLVDEGYYNQTSIPVIISLKQNVEGKQNVKGVGILGIRGLSIEKAFKKIRAVSAKIDVRRTQAAFAALNAEQAIDKVWLDKKIHVSLNVSVPLINASSFWSAGYNGSGIIIAILDTGIDSTHPDLDDLDDNPATNDPKVIKAIDFTDDRNPSDFFGHGTHVASIAAGTGEASNYTYVGVAPKAKLWNVKVLNRHGWGYESWVIDGVEFAAYGPDGIPNTGDEADIISMSLGGAPTDGTDPLSQTVNAAVDAGVVVVVAAGNNGNYFTISSPGTADKAITVGATNKEDRLAWFSSKGPTLGLNVKPDVVAPGVEIVAARASGTSMGTPVNEYYTSASGTSMATPHVSGAAALILQKGVPNGWKKPKYVKNILISTAKDLNLNVYEQGGGRIDLAEVLSAEILVDPATISFGQPDGESSAVITFYNLNATSERTLSFDVEVTDLYGNSFDAAYVNTSSVTIPPNSKAAILLTVNSTSLPKNLYSGKLRIFTDNGRVLKVVFGFAKMNKVVIVKKRMDGEPADYDDVWVYRVNLTSCDEFFSRFIQLNESGMAVVFLPDGYYNFWSLGLKSARVWTTKDEVPVFSDTVVVLDERDAVPITFDPNKPNQIVAELCSGLAYNESNGCNMACSWQFLSAYPQDVTTYVTPTSSNVFHSYEYYPEVYYNPLDAWIINTPEWHNLFFAEDGISCAKHYVADYSQLVNKTACYFTALADESVYKAEWASAKDIYARKRITFAWEMKAPQVRAEYLSPETYYSGSVDCWDEKEWSLYDIDEHIYSAGEKTEETWNMQPFVWDHNVIRKPDEIWVWGHVFVDRNGHGYRNKPPASNVTIYRDGVEIYNGTTSGYFYYYSDSEPLVANYTILLEGRSGQELAVRSKVILNFTYAYPPTDYKPPKVYFIEPEQTLYNTMNGMNVTIRVIDENEYGVVEDGSTIANVSLSYSLDDGNTWINVPLTKNGSEYSGRLDIDGDCFVSLKVLAVDSSGNSAYYEIIRATYAGEFVPAKPARFTGYFDDYGEDDNANGLYDYLVVEVGVNVTQAGNYLITGYIYENGTSNEVDRACNETYLPEGEHVIELRFDGTRIWSNGFNGSYDVMYLGLYNATRYASRSLGKLEAGANRTLTPENVSAMYGEQIDHRDYAYTTSYYNYTDFEPLPADFTGNFNDYGLDTDGDGYYNYLVVQAEVKVREAGWYELEGDLEYFNDEGWWEEIDHNSNCTYLEEGTHVLSLQFNGYAIRNTEYNGSFRIWMRLEGGEEWTKLNSTEYFTEYNYTDFEPIPPDQYRLEEVEYEWVDGVTDGTPLEMGDDDCATVTLPFIFTFYGGTFDTIYISSNGHVSFANTCPIDYTEHPIPSTDPYDQMLIAVLWDDWNPDTSEGDVYVKNFEDKFVVTWYNILHSPYYGPASTFQLVLYKNGSIRFNYQTIGYTDGYTVGLNKGDGGHYTVYDGEVSSEMSLLFVPPGTPIANFTYKPEKPMINEDVEFNASSSYDPDGMIVEYEWEFGDGNSTTKTDPIVVYNYSSPGCYQVNLTVVDDCGLLNQTSKCIAVGCGDVNCDGDVNMGDVIALLYHVGYGSEICSEWAADVNGDGDVNMGDVIALLYHVGYGEELECICLFS